VRRIARKYKTQYEELLKTVEEERANRQGDPAVEQQLKDRINVLETRIHELESSSAAADTREKERQSQLAQAEAKAEELKKQVTHFWTSEIKT
jgi:chromosome segregation ATPase